MEDIKDIVKGLSEALDSKKAEDIRVIPISDISDIADYFVIATANNIHQMEALQDITDEYMVKSGLTVRNIEGHARDRSNRILMDYGDIIVHLFDKEAREFYNLEHLWKGVEKLPRQRQEADPTV